MPGGEAARRKRTPDGTDEAGGILVGSHVLRRRDDPGGRRSRLARLPAAATGAALAILGIGLGPAAGTAAARTAQPPMPVTDPAAYVDPLIGTGTGGSVVGTINTFPGPDVPFGMLQWSPDTTSGASAGGYYYGDSRIRGFSLTHLSGVGCYAMGDIPFLPTTGPVGSDPQDATSSFSHSTEQASAGYYAVTLADSGIRAELTTTLRTGIGRFTYPKTTAANMLIKAGDSLAGNDAATVQVIGPDEVVGSATSGHFCGMPNQYTVYFAAVFDHPFTSWGTWNGGTVTPGSTRIATAAPSRAARTRAARGADTAPGAPQAKLSPRTAEAAQQASGPHVGAYVTFDTTDNPVVQAKVAVSFVSVAGAEANLAAEQPGWNFGGTHAAAVAAWNHLLSRVRVSGGTPAELTTFYTALYHTLLHPNVFSDADGAYIGFDSRIHHVPAGHAQYANYSGWDIYRSEVPLQALLVPHRAADIAQSLVNDAEQGGWLPKWGEANDYTGVMNGDAADPIIADIAAFGSTGFDTHAALAAMIKGATDTSSPPGQWGYVERPDLASYLKLGYVPNTGATSISPVPNGASETLEYATADFAISQFARSLGETPAYKTFLGRSQNWTSIFNVDSGYIQPRDAHGQFPAGDPVTAGMGGFGQSGFQEGNAAQYTWMVPQDLHGLFTAMGGNAAAVRRLDAFFSQLNVGPNEPYMWAGNEPSLGTPWEYDYAGAPYKTQQVVREIMTQLYGDTPGGMPGNDDLGAMSAWYVWAALGLYPETPGVPELVTGSPLFPHAAITLPTGRTLAIDAPGASASAPYVHALTLNGRPWPRTWLPASAIRAGGTLSYTLSSSPDPSWGAAPQDAPHSYPAGPLRFPPGLLPATVASSPSRLAVTAGARATATLTFAAGTGAGAQSPPAPAVRSITWSATPPAGVTLTPASGTLALGPDGTAATTVTASAASGMAQGFYAIPITLASSPAAPLPALELDIAVVGTGDTATTCTTLGATNTDHGLQQVEFSGDGVTTPVTEDGLSGRETVQEVPDDLNMYFLIDPRIASDGDFTATFTITYYDTGTSTWTLQYDSANPSGGPVNGAYTAALTVANHNTGTWQTATVTVHDARFAERENGSTDFRIASPGPVTVHSVQVQVSGPGVLPVNLCG
ncbi:MAG TPA: GH92 family glycosyl hydrolase [Streptosporangiaceae bacterium]|nr:GH92 family glycosyl hydrolase [Streptosporangiaceae bacterium]